jgi:two-component system sensor histidine kinase YesM
MYASSLYIPHKDKGRRLPMFASKLWDLYASRPYSLKNRLIFMLFTSSLTPLVLIGTISYFSMYAILKNKVEAGVKSKLLKDEIQSQLNLIHFTNPTLGLIFYYLGNNNQKLFENFSVRENSDPNKLPKLFNFNTITYFGPHLSLNPIDGNQVLSIMRQVEILGRNDVYVYIETNFKLAESIIKNEQFGNHLTHLIVDNEGRIAYSENPRDFPVGTMYSAETNTGVWGKYYRFEESSFAKGRIALELFGWQPRIATVIWPDEGFLETLHFVQ